jgi:hypothetical protein
MVGTHKTLRVSTPLGHGHKAVTANVRQCTYHPILPMYDHERFIENIYTVIVTRDRDVFRTADTEPLFSENGIQFERI